MTEQRFQESRTDEALADAIFPNSRRLWCSIEEEVKIWVESNWIRWNAEKPKWFDESMRNRIPIDLIPTVAERRLEIDKRGSISAKGGNKNRIVPEPKVRFRA